jgi:hypothetical protein
LCFQCRSWLSVLRCPNSDGTPHSNRDAPFAYLLVFSPRFWPVTMTFRVPIDRPRFRTRRHEFFFSHDQEIGFRLPLVSALLGLAHLRKAIIPTKAVGATNRMEGQQCKQAIERLMLRLGEQHRCAQRALLTKPKEPRKPAERAHTRRGFRLLRFQHLTFCEAARRGEKFHPLVTVHCGEVSSHVSSVNRIDIARERERRGSFRA